MTKKNKMRRTEIDGTANHLFAQKTNSTTRKQKKRVSNVRVFISILLFFFPRSLFCRIHSFRCSGGIARSKTQPKEAKKKTETNKQNHFSNHVLGAHTLAQIEIQFGRIENACSHCEESYQTNRIRSTNCRARANIKFDFFKLKNKLHDERKRCTKEATRKKKSESREENAESIAESNRETDLQSRKRRHDSFNADNFFSLAPSSSSTTFFSVHFPVASLSLALFVSVYACILNGFKHFQFAVGFAPHVKWNVEIFISRFFLSSSSSHLI